MHGEPLMRRHTDKAADEANAKASMLNPKEAACTPPWVPPPAGTPFATPPAARHIGAHPTLQAPFGGKLPPVDVQATLDERGKRYGVFAGHAEITQTLKDAMRGHPGWQRLSPDKREALDMNAHKVGRILNGDPEYKDSWVDIAGYATLVANTLKD